MINPKYLLIAALPFIYKFTNSESDATKIIAAKMQEQQEAWNNGNIEGFMFCYWKSDSLSFIGKNGPQYGWQKTLDNYKKSYPDAATMGRLQFTNLKINPMGTEYVYVMGQWKLVRSSDTISGYYTLIWQHINGEWVIISDHSS